MKVLIDMNLSPSWKQVLQQAGWEAVHWMEVGEASAPDGSIMAWARQHGYVVLTHDLDFSALLAATRARGPSVVQVRTQDVLPGTLAQMLVPALRQFEGLLEAGALISIDEERARARILPLV